LVSRAARFVGQWWLLVEGSTGPVGVVVVDVVDGEVLKLVLVPDDPAVD
jgi:hypothetical protein